VEVVASLSQGRTAAAQCGLFTHKSVPVIFEPPCIWIGNYQVLYMLQNLDGTIHMQTTGQADPSELKIRFDGFVKENVASIKWSVSVPYAPQNRGRNGNT